MFIRAQGDDNVDNIVTMAIPKRVFTEKNW